MLSKPKPFAKLLNKLSDCIPKTKVWLPEDSVALNSKYHLPVVNPKVQFILCQVSSVVSAFRLPSETVTPLLWSVKGFIVG